MSVIISNTTRINYLVLIDQIDVLRHLYACIIIPQAVLGELQDEGTPGKVNAWVASHPGWLDIRNDERFGFGGQAVILPNRP